MDMLKIVVYWMKKTYLTKAYLYCFLSAGLLIRRKACSVWYFKLRREEASKNKEKKREKKRREKKRRLYSTECYTVFCLLVDVVFVIFPHLENPMCPRPQCLIRSCCNQIKGSLAHSSNAAPLMKYCLFWSRCQELPSLNQSSDLRLYMLPVLVHKKWTCLFYCLATLWKRRVAFFSVHQYFSKYSHYIGRRRFMGIKNKAQETWM